MISSDWNKEKLYLFNNFVKDFELHLPTQMAAPTLTTEQFNLLSDSWEKGVKLNLDHHAMVLFLGYDIVYFSRYAAFPSLTFMILCFRRIFERAPQVKQLFSFLKDLPEDAPLDKNPVLQKHANGALKAVSTFLFATKSPKNPCSVSNFLDFPAIMSGW